MTIPSEPARMQDPLAEIERHLLRAYLAGAGHDLDELSTRHDETARGLLAHASRYASGRLSEIEARWHYLQHLHGEP
jgi:hypothetical protein